MMQYVIKTIAALFSQHYGEESTPKQIAVKMFDDYTDQCICVE